MRVTVYNCREFDEKDLFVRYGQELGIELVLCADAPDMENIALSKGSECVDIITSQITRPLMKAFHDNGVKYLTTRTIGYDHIDMEAAREFGIKVANAPYGPNGVADYTVMLILMSVRKMKRIIERTNIQDYTLAGIQGREIKDLTIGIIGTGRIGRCVIHNLSGFGCKILAYDLYENEEVRQYADYVLLDELIARSDVISLHTPLTDENYHLINEKSIAMMKDGVVIINTARGGLIDSQALISAVESGKIGAAGLDVVENEFGLYYYDHKSDILNNRELAVLRGFPNVTVSHHMAFYTDNCVETVVRDSLTGCKLFMEGKENPWEVA
ncbi:MAG: D-isomer specific 2-hydroxyacid dehydrogenase family protein [Bacillus sp. (in: Bacteria)]|nr:D-isomer specific 2-hydroxyacid dehydrogenase family protein [Bacillus sp. (in: firmicutes)]MCM1427203.1 D-isomer specific 2-hydroxyacid dehydrogenase family protein [Eubacterium sp.]